MKRFQVRVPASSSNLGPGFDVLGLAVNLYLTLRIEPSPNGTQLFLLNGVDSEFLARQQQNLILEVAQTVCRRMKLPLPPLRVTTHNEIPVSRGLGSSAAAIIAGISIAEAVHDLRFTPEEIIQHALEFESHPDNLAACLMGGLTASGVVAPQHPVILPLPVDPRLKLVVVVPEFRVSTYQARAVLPARYKRSDVILNLQHAVLLSHILKKVRPALPGLLFEDRIHQPYRERIIPGLREALSLPPLEGLLGVYLSGSGSTVAAMAVSNFQQIGRKLQNCFSKQQLSSKMLVLRIDRNGRNLRHLA